MPKKRILMLLGSVCLALMLALPLVASCAAPTPTPTPAPTPEVIEWRFHSPHTEGRLDYVADKDWCDMVTEATSGRLKMTIYPSGALGFKEADMLRTCGNGVIEVFSAYNGYYTRDDPAIGMLFPASGIFTTKAEAMKMLPVSNELNKELFGVWGIAILGSFLEPACYYGVCSTKPVNTLEQLKEVKIRCWDVMQASTFKELGVPGEILSLQDVYLGIKTGMLDATLGAPGHMLALSINEVTDYYSILGPLSATQIMACNKDAFEALPVDIQNIVLQVSKEHEQKWLVETMKCTTDKEALASMGESGITVLPEFSAEDKLTLSEVALKVWEARAKEYGPRAAEYQQKMAAELQRIRGT